MINLNTKKNINTNKDINSIIIKPSEKIRIFMYRRFLPF